MANQRMEIRCKVCGEEKFLAKRLGGNFYTLKQTMNRNEWDRFFIKHEWGHCRPCNDNPWGLDVFELVYEHADSGFQ